MMVFIIIGTLFIALIILIYFCKISIIGGDGRIQIESKSKKEQPFIERVNSQKEKILNSDDFTVFFNFSTDGPKKKPTFLDTGNENILYFSKQIQQDTSLWRPLEVNSDWFMMKNKHEMFISEKPNFIILHMIIKKHLLLFVFYLKNDGFFSDVLETIQNYLEDVDKNNLFGSHVFVIFINQFIAKSFIEHENKKDLDLNKAQKLSQHERVVLCANVTSFEEIKQGEDFVEFTLDLQKYTMLQFPKLTPDTLVSITKKENCRL